MSETPARRLLALAIERQNWELAALCLVIEAVEKVRALPPEAADEMLGLLDIDEGMPTRRGRECRERRRR